MDAKNNHKVGYDYFCSTKSILKEEREFIVNSNYNFLSLTFCDNNLATSKISDKNKF